MQEAQDSRKFVQSRDGQQAHEISQGRFLSSFALCNSLLFENAFCGSICFIFNFLNRKSGVVS